VRAALKGEQKHNRQQRRAEKPSATSLRRRAEQQSAKQTKLARAVQTKITQDREAVLADEKLAKWLKQVSGLFFFITLEPRVE